MGQKGVEKSVGEERSKTRVSKIRARHLCNRSLSFGGAAGDIRKPLGGAVGLGGRRLRLKILQPLPRLLRGWWCRGREGRSGCEGGRGPGGEVGRAWAVKDFQAG